MTVIAVKKEQNDIHLVCDSRITACGSERADKELSLTKIIISNDLYIGISGYTSEATFLSIFINTNIPEGNTIKDIVNYFHKFFLWYKEMSNNELMGHYIVVYKGKIYTVVSPIFEVIEITSFYSVGSGRDFAITALHLGKSAKEAVAIACELDAFCDEPIKEYFIK